MNQKDWQRAFGDAPEDFHLHLQSTLDGLEERNMKKHYKFSTVLIAAALCAALLAGAGIAANRLGIFDFFGQTAEPITPLPGAVEMVGTNLGMAENELATLSVEEAVFDGQGALVKLKLAPKDAQNNVLFNTFMQGAPEEEYIIAREPLEMPLGATQTRMEDDVETKIINHYNEQKLIIGGVELPIPESEQEALENGLPVYRKDGKLWYSEEKDFKVLGRRDGRAMLGYQLRVYDVQEREYALMENVREQEDGSLLIWASLWAEDCLAQDSLTLKIDLRIFKPDGEEIPMETIEIMLPKTVEERRARIVPVGDGKIAGLQLYEGEATFTRVRGYIHMDYSYDPVEEEFYKELALYYYNADGSPIPSGSGSGTVGYGEGSWTEEIQSFETLPETIWLEAKMVDGEVLGRIECKVIEE